MPRDTASPSHHLRLKRPPCDYCLFPGLVWSSVLFYYPGLVRLVGPVSQMILLMMLMMVMMMVLCRGESWRGVVWP